MQGRDRQDCFHRIVPSSSSQRSSFLKGFLLLFLFAAVCIFVCLWERERQRKSAQVAGKRENKVTMQCRDYTSANLSFLREKKRGNCNSEHAHHSVWQHVVCVCACLLLFMRSLVHVHLGGGKLRMRSKANNFIGGLHNSAAIPGVIVFPLRLSCRDESLMPSCPGIMDGTGQLLPTASTGRVWEWMGAEERIYGGHVCTMDREWTKRRYVNKEVVLRVCV